MLSVNTEKGFLPIENRNDYYIQMNYDGFHQLSFDVSNDDEILKYLINEAVIKNEDNRFLIKAVNMRTQNSTFTCEIDLDEWKQTVFFDTANDTRFQTKTLGEILNVIKPSGWKILNSSIRSIRRTPELKDATPYDVLISLESIYNVVYDIRVLTKEIYVIDPSSIEYDGLYATDELNMKKVTWQGSSSEFCTKLFAYGKANEDGTVVNIASVNGGKEYIEDHTYTDKVITLVWRDERYTDPQSLLDDANKKLDILCVPKMSYDVAIYDLAQVNKDYDFLQFGLYKQIKTFVNKDLSLMQRVVTYKKYYDKHDRNVATLSNEQQKFTSKVSNLLGGSSNTVVNGSILEQAQKESAQIINEFATKGYRYETENETYFLDKLPKEAAKYVMRMNLGGIAFSQSGWSGPYTTAWTIDGKFNAEFITTGVLKAIKIESSEIYGGKINGGSIDGTTIKGSTFVVEKKRTVKVYAGEPEQLMNYILGTGTLTEEQKQRLDINQNGRIDSLDYYLAMEIYSGRVSGNFIDTITINNDNIPQITLRTTNGKNEYKTIIKTGSVTTSDFDSTYATIKSIETNNISFLNSDSRIGVGDLNDVRTLMVSGFNLPTYIDGSSIECNGNNSLRCNRAWQVTSDKRLKRDIDDIPKEFIDIWLSLQPKMFRLNNASDEIMIGLLAQDVIKEFEKVGLDYMDYDFIGEFMIDNSGEKYFSVSYDFYFILTSLITKRLYEDVEKMKEKLK